MNIKLRLIVRNTAAVLGGENENLVDNAPPTETDPFAKFIAKALKWTPPDE